MKKRQVFDVEFQEWCDIDENGYFINEDGTPMETLAYREIGEVDKKFFCICGKIGCNGTECKENLKKMGERRETA